MSETVSGSVPISSEEIDRSEEIDPRSSGAYSPLSPHALEEIKAYVRARFGYLRLSPHISSGGDPVTLGLSTPPALYLEREEVEIERTRLG